MNSKGLRWVPDDLLIRVSRMFKVSRPEFGDTVGQHIVDCLAATRDNETRRLIIISHLPGEMLKDKEKIDLGKWEKAQKTLMGVWQGQFDEGAVWGNIFCVIDDAWKSHRAGSGKAGYWLDLVKLYRDNAKNPAQRSWLEKGAVMCGAEPEPDKDK